MVDRFMSSGPLALIPDHRIPLAAWGYTVPAITIATTTTAAPGSQKGERDKQ